MPAKRKAPLEADPADKRKAVKAKALLAFPPPVQATERCINASLQQELAKCDEDVLLCPVFTDIRDLEPTSRSGVPTYSADAFAAAMAAGREYVASCPLHWLLLGYELQPNIPKSKARIMNLK